MLPAHRFRLAVLLFSTLATTSYSQSGPARLSPGAPVFLKPDSTRTPLTTVEAAGLAVTVLSRDGDWYCVKFKGQFGERTGYVEARWLVNSAPTQGTPSVRSAAVPTAPAPAPVQPLPPTPTAAKPPAPTPDPVSESITAPVSALDVLPTAAVAAAVQVGLRGKGQEQGLRLIDSQQQFAAAMTASSYGRGSNGFSLRAYTPVAWVRQLASNAAKEYRTLDPAELGREHIEMVLRLFVNPDTPNTVTASGMSGTSSVQHVVLRDESKRIVIQPLSKEAFTEEVANAMGGRATFQGLVAKFDMDDLTEIRKGDGEFFITVIGASGEEKNFKVKKKHLERMP